VNEPELPKLDSTRCDGCGECAAICPTECLEMHGPLVRMPRPADCVSCGACVVVCTPEALVLPHFA
jgi:ferredoxin